MFFKGCDLIIHAGDIIRQDDISKLEEICKVECVRGNNDYMLPVEQFPNNKVLIINENIEIYVIHDLDCMYDEIQDYNIVIHGHTHKPEEKYVGNTLVLNPGSFGPIRFSLPISLATIDFDKDNKFTVKFHQI